MKAVISLGANIGNPREQVELAIALLAGSLDVSAVSSLYETKPVGKLDQPNFINAIVIAESQLPALEVLHILQGIEKALGRERKEKWGPRLIDLDLIQYGGEKIASAELTLPHPHAHERAFVLKPWSDLEPDAVLDGYGSIAQLLEQLPEAL